MDIIDFIKEKDYKIELGPWFNSIWLPISKKTNILMTNDLLNFIHYGISGSGIPDPSKIKKIKYNIIESIKNYNINYTEIKYNDAIVDEYEYIQNDIKTLAPNNLVQKTWILLSVRNFKKLLINLKKTEIIDYIIEIEKISDDYNNYLKNYELILKYNKNHNPVNIFEFINSNNYNLELGSWFRDIWYSLFNQKNIIITNEILNFIYDLEKLYQNKRDYKSFLTKNEIDYSVLKYNKNILSEYSINNLIK
ncbi:N1R/p28-like protein [Choristoneura biennis entomopoxvirus]|uniref:N1R/p28-like protein n=1 Tax=Choristoneura biennis entomopoxvirus TaxID=10288 RepID=A0A916KPD5_CBEPV|nr:N1R/p28-like protein [Choristoneura biennis entomopoxvirus]YP_008004394.1 N1R/p28-like protein [Choristoneura biennis entomopoxvirus]CCU55579.1 N1R/p28-like protein [Choristoneura biennis entomopoxvirus]CCU55892.1 N1R/p28-like protein [Choristoneura biennis entomopoxvirus]